MADLANGVYGVSVLSRAETALIPDHVTAVIQNLSMMVKIVSVIQENLKLASSTLAQVIITIYTSAYI